MNNSVQHFYQEGAKNLAKNMVDYATDMTKRTELVQGVTKTVMDSAAE